VQLNFPDSVAYDGEVEQGNVAKLYTGENAKYLVGPEKIPEYLTVFLEGMRQTG